MEIFVFLFDFLICQNEAMVKQMGVFGLLDSCCQCYVLTAAAAAANGRALPSELCHMRTYLASERAYAQNHRMLSSCKIV
jgi:hypothetical protein